MTRRTLSLAVLVVLVLWGGLAGANTAPLAEAGLDQQTERGSTVYLDAGGSVDPDGTIAAYRWTITAPDGSTLRPDCPRCARTQFVPTQTGRYAVTVAVTDDDGATTRDTLYVDVNPANPPALDLTGPTTVPANTTRTYSADATAGDADLSSLVWQLDDTSRTRVRLNGTNATTTETMTLPPGNHTITATVRDADGQQATETLNVTAVPTTGGAAIDIENDENSTPTGRDDGGAVELIMFDVETGTWDVDTELASRMDSTVKVGDAEVSTKTLRKADSSSTIVNIFESAGTTEDQMVRSAAQRRNNCVGGGCGLDTVDNEPGQVRYEGPYPNEDSDNVNYNGRNSGSSGSFVGGYVGGDGSSRNSGGDTGDVSSTGGGYNGGSSYSGGGGYGF